MPVGPARGFGSDGRRWSGLAGAGWGAAVGEHGTDRRLLLRRFEVFIQCSTILCDPYPSHPQLHRPLIVTTQVLDVLRLLLNLRMLENEAEVCGGLVFVLIVLSVVDVYIVKLHKADQVTRRLGLPFRHVVNSRSSQLEQALLP